MPNYVVRQIPNRVGGVHNSSVRIASAIAEHENKLKGGLDGRFGSNADRFSGNSDCAARRVLFRKSVGCRPLANRTENLTLR
jgi:hypothetical protein